MSLIGVNNILVLNVLLFLALASYQDIKEKKVFRSFPYSMVAVFWIVQIAFGSVFSLSFWLLTIPIFFGYLFVGYLFKKIMNWGFADTTMFSALGLILPSLGLHVAFLQVFIVGLLVYPITYNLALKKSWKEKVPLIPMFLIAFLISLII